MLYQVKTFSSPLNFWYMCSFDKEKLRDENDHSTLI